MPSEGWRSLGVPEELHKAIQEYLNHHPELGYTGVGEFTRDQLRHLLLGPKTLAQSAIPPTRKTLEVHV